jgi:hypothetical protein
LVKLALGFWVLRWAAQELAAYAGRHWQRPGPPPRESARRPGWLPGPSEETLRRFE